MGGIMKLVGIVVIALVGFGIWKFTSAPEVPSEKSNLLEVTEKDWVKGGVNAPVTLVEYTDFQCPACGAYYPLIKQLTEELGDKVKVVIRHYPLIQIHKNALPSARAAEAAGRQGKFWEMYDLLFTNQNEWSLAEDPTKSIFPSYATRIGIDVEQFRKDIADSSIDDKITHDRGTGDSLEITGTPTFFLNGKKLENPRSIEEFKSLVEKAKSTAPGE
ncbi:MAG: DsbA family protein [Candidatus Moranbacteria bacterium]|nr:DsbA family protein [Candidatus Moranbacteria bacterium]